MITPVSDRIIEIFVKEDMLIEAGDLREVYRTLSELAQGKRYLIIFVAPQYSSFTKEALDEISIQNKIDFTLAEAVVLNSVAMKLTAKFHFRDENAPFPSEIFSTVEQAIVWLNGLEL